MNIYPVTHGKGDKNRFCGPAAVSILTGMNTGEAARLIRHVTGKTLVAGTLGHHIDKALRRCNLYIDMVANYGYREVKLRPTLSQWLKDTQTMRTAGRV